MSSLALESKSSSSSSSSSASKSAKGKSSVAATLNKKLEKSKKGQSGKPKKVATGAAEERKGRSLSERIHISCSNAARISGNAWRQKVFCKLFMELAIRGHFEYVWNLVMEVAGSANVITELHVVTALQLANHRRGGVTIFDSWAPMAARNAQLAMTHKKNKTRDTKKKNGTLGVHKGGVKKSKAAFTSVAAAE